MRIHRIVLLAAVCGLLKGIMIVPEENVESLFDIISKLGFSEFVIQSTYLEGFLSWYAPFILFQTVGGVWIYRHFCTASVYFFTRINYRSKWFLQEMGKLFLHVLCYLFFLIFFCALPTICVKGLVITPGVGGLLLYYLLLHSLWLYMVTLFINILSIRWGSSTGFLCGMGVQIIGIGMYVLFQNFLNFEERTDIVHKTTVLKLNPISHLVLKWHSSGIEVLEQRLNEFHISFDFNESVVLFLILAALLSGWGMWIVQKQELITNNSETGG